MRRVFFFLLMASVCLAQSADPRWEQIIESHVANHGFMGTVLVAEGDRVMLDKGYGSANLEWNVPNSPTVKFRLGSVTKQFTAVACCCCKSGENGRFRIR